MIRDRGCEHLFEVDSAGTYSGHRGELADPRMRRHAKKRGIEITHRARPVTGFDFTHFDLIIGMDAANVSNLRRLAPSPEDAAKVKPIGQWIKRFRNHYDYVPDPYYEGHEGFELVLDLLEDACANLLNDLLQNNEL